MVKTQAEGGVQQGTTKGREGEGMDGDEGLNGNEWGFCGAAWECPVRKLICDIES